jgi:hypothetical protein
MPTKSSKAKQRESKSTASAKDSAIVKPVMKNGLPPGISQQQAKNPGSTSGSKRVKNNS